MEIITEQFNTSTKGFNDIIDITDNIESFVHKNNLFEGQLLVFINGATAAISTMEYEPGLLKDIPNVLEKIAPMNDRYYHNETWHDGNGYAHVRSTLMSPMIILPVFEGKIVRGTWQQVILLDFDNRPRHRVVTLQFTGNKN